MCASEKAPDFKGQITLDRSLFCGNPRCTQKHGQSQGRVSQHRVLCHHCRKISLYDEPIAAPPVGYTPEQEIVRERLALARDAEKTDFVLAQSLADVVKTFQDFLSNRHQRLVAV